MRTFYLIAIVITFSNCSHTDENNTTTASGSSVSIDTTSKPEKTVLNFLKWYRDNGNGLANDLVLNIGNKDWDSTKFYAVNFPATETYLVTLKETGMISNKYTDKWQEYFKKWDQNLKNNPANDGPPDGFDYDFITFSQEDPGLSDLDKTKMTVTESDGKSAQVLIQFPSTYQYKYTLTKYGPHWQIDDIENVTK